MTEEIVSPVEGRRTRRRRRGIGCRKKKGEMLVGGRRKGDGCWREGGQEMMKVEGKRIMWG